VQLQVVHSRTCAYMITYRCLITTTMNSAVAQSKIGTLKALFKSREYLACKDLDPDEILSSVGCMDTRVPSFKCVSQIKGVAAYIEYSHCGVHTRACHVADGSFGVGHAYAGSCFKPALNETGC
jgi:hypothetical protein